MKHKYTIIDAHAHLGPYFSFHIAGDPSADGMVALMDRLGISQCLISSHLAISKDAVAGNREVVDASASYPDRILGWMTIDPHRPEIFEKEIELLMHRGFVGFKLHPGAHDYPADGEGYAPAWEYAQRNGCPVLSHTWGGMASCSPSMFAGLAEKYPKVPILLGHSGATDKGVEEAVSVAGKNDNVFLEICSSIFTSYRLEWLVGQGLEDRIIFGTDFPFIDPRPILGSVLSSRISEEAREKVFSGNITRILKS